MSLYLSLRIYWKVLLRKIRKTYPINYSSLKFEPSADVFSLGAIFKDDLLSNLTFPPGSPGAKNLGLIQCVVDLMLRSESDKRPPLDEIDSFLKDKIKKLDQLNFVKYISNNPQDESQIVKFIQENKLGPDDGLSTVLFDLLQLRLKLENEEKNINSAKRIWNKLSKSDIKLKIEGINYLMNQLVAARFIGDKTAANKILKTVEKVYPDLKNSKEHEVIINILKKAKNRAKKNNTIAVIYEEHKLASAPSLDVKKDKVIKDEKHQQKIASNPQREVTAAEMSTQGGGLVYRLARIFYNWLQPKRSSAPQKIASDFKKEKKVPEMSAGGDGLVSRLARIFYHWIKPKKVIKIKPEPEPAIIRVRDAKKENNNPSPNIVIKPHLPQNRLIKSNSTGNLGKTSAVLLSEEWRKRRRSCDNADNAVSVKKNTLSLSIS